MSQSVSSWSPVGEGTMCAEEDEAWLHNHSWSAWQRSMLELDLRTDALLLFKTCLYCHAVKQKISPVKSQDLQGLQWLTGPLLDRLFAYIQYESAKTRTGVTAS